MPTLDRYYFNSLNLEPIRRKFYNIQEVDSVLLDIRTQAEILNRENEDLKNDIKLKEKELSELREKLKEADSKKEELNDALISARTTYRGIVDKANEEADEIIAGARIEQQEMKEKTRRRQEYAVDRIGEIYAFMKESQEAQAEQLNLMFQQFLCGLEEDDAPDDLSSKVGRIAKEMQEINNK